LAKDILTNTACANAKCPKGITVRKLHDGGGLYLWVFPNGTKYWRLRYRQAGKEKLEALGVYPAVSLKDARDKRVTIDEQLEAGQDPAEVRKAEKRAKQAAAANSFEFVATEWLGNQSNKWVATRLQDVTRRLKANIFNTIGTRPIDQIEAPELLAAIRKIEDRGAYNLAHRVLQGCGQIFRYGIVTGRCKRDLSADLRGALVPHVGKNQNAVKREDLPKLLLAISDYEKTGDRLTRIALQLLAQTFVRTNELIGAEWAEIDMDKAVWTIPAERMKMKIEHVVPLARQTVNLLEELRPLSGTSRFLFPGRNSATTMSNNTMLYALYRLGYKGRMSGHGFRAVASTILNGSGKFSPDVIERQLAHGERDAVRAAYNRAEYLDDRKKMMQWWADHLDGLVNESKVIVGNFQAA
jgi:integrase